MFRRTLEEGRVDGKVLRPCWSLAQIGWLNGGNFLRIVKNVNMVQLDTKGMGDLLYVSMKRILLKKKSLG